MGELREDRQSHFFGWLSRFVSSAQLSELYQAFTELEDAISSHKYLHHLTRSLIESTDANAIDQLYNDLSANRQFMHSYKPSVKLSLLKHYAHYCRENKVADMTNNTKEETASTDDALIDRLKRDGISYIDNRPKNGALWIAKTLKTDVLIRDFKSQGVHFSFSEAKQQWWTRDQTKKATTASDISYPTIIKQNQNTFIEWLRTQNYDAVEVFSIYGTARKIHKMLLTERSPSGLFGIQGLESIRESAKVARTKKDFILGNRQERGLWTATLDSYLRFAEEQETSIERIPVEEKPSSGHGDLINTKPIENSDHVELPQTEKQSNILTSEEGFRLWLSENHPDENADSIIAAIRVAERFAQRTHIHGNRLFGIDPSVVKVNTYHIISRAFANSDASGYREFKYVAPLLLEYSESLRATVTPAPQKSLIISPQGHTFMNKQILLVRRVLSLRRLSTPC